MWLGLCGAQFCALAVQHEEEVITSDIVWLYDFLLCLHRKYAIKKLQ